MCIWKERMENGQFMDNEKNIQLARQGYSTRQTLIWATGHWDGQN